jgi:hypothetical protein
MERPPPPLRGLLLLCIATALLLLPCSVSASASDCGIHPEWCDVPPPVKSYFGFEPPTDLVRWRSAQIAAASGEHSLLKESLKQFSMPNDFLDGDTAFKYIHHYTDIFLDREQGFSSLTDGSGPAIKAARNYWRHDSYKPSTRIPIVMAGYGRCVLIIICLILFNTIYSSI